MYIDDPITITVQLDNLLGETWSQLYQALSPTEPCLFRVLVIDPIYPNDNQILWSCGTSFSAVNLGCSGPTSVVDTYVLQPFGYSYPLGAGPYTVQVDLDPSCDHIQNPGCVVTGLPVMEYIITVREGAKTDIIADLDISMNGVGECEDTFDNDNDSLIDCDDPDCAGKDGCP